VYIKLSRAAEAVNTRVNQHLKGEKLTISQFGVLEAIYHLGPMHQNRLAEKILKSSGNLTLVIDNLEKRGLVTRERDPEDRRCMTIDLTEAGRALIESIFPRHVGIVVQEINVLSMEEQNQLATLCRKLGLADQIEL
jgi:MarR family 2-MHQ and catechol resistance regulon transcriptional repressor